MSYILVTNIYNEEERIHGLFQNILSQSLLPKSWIWIDDGSTDKGLDVAKRLAKEYSIEIVTFKLPQKEKGNLDTIGRAWNVAHQYMINNLEADYISVADVDTVFPSDYFEKMIDFMNLHPSVGVCSGVIRCEEAKNMLVPMGLGKIVRWKILQSFDKYWDLAPDSFLNIKAQSLGYELVVRNVKIDSSPMTIFSEKGRFRYGRRAYYIGKHPFLVFLESVRFLLIRQYASTYLRGYWQEWSKGTWRCDDLDIRYFYSLRRCILDFLRKQRI